MARKKNDVELKAPLAQKIIEEVKASLEEEYGDWSFNTMTGRDGYDAVEGIKNQACEPLTDNTKVDYIVSPETMDDVKTKDGWVLTGHRNTVTKKEKETPILLVLREVRSDDKNKLPHSLLIDVACAKGKKMHIIRRVVDASKKTDSGVHELYISPALGSKQELMQIYGREGFKFHREDKGSMPVLYHPLVRDRLKKTKRFGKGLGKNTLKRHRKILRFNQSDFERLTTGK